MKNQVTGHLPMFTSDYILCTLGRESNVQIRKVVVWFVCYLRYANFAVEHAKRIYIATISVGINFGWSWGSDQVKNWSDAEETIDSN